MDVQKEEERNGGEMVKEKMAMMIDEEEGKVDGRGEGERKRR